MQLNWVSISRLLGLSLVLLIVNITEGVSHGDRISINIIAAVASACSLGIGALSTVDELVRIIVKRLGFMVLEWIQILELFIVSGLCTTIAVLSSVDNDSPAEVISVAMALSTALVLRVDLSITTRVASLIYVEKLVQAAGNDVAAASMRASLRLGASRSPGIGGPGDDDTRLFGDVDISDIEPPQLSVASVAIVHVLAAIALPAPLVGAFISAGPRNAVVGHLVGVLCLSWIRVGHSFFSVLSQVRMIQQSDSGEKEFKDLATAVKAAEQQNSSRAPYAFDDEQLELTQTRGRHFSDFNTLSAGSLDITPGGGTTSAGTSVLNGSNKHALGAFITTVSTTQTFRNRALSIRTKESIGEVVHQQKPSYKKGMVIGRGGFSTVYACMNNHTGEMMAAKKISFPADDERTEERMALLSNEVNMLRSIDHPHVVKYLFCDQPAVDDGAADSDIVEFYIFMEYVGGGSLKDLIKHFGALAEPAAASFVAQILLGLTYLHNSGRVHRDVKAANVLCRSDGHVKISDFGTAVDLNRDGEAAAEELLGDEALLQPQAAEDGPRLVGTPLYSPPELMRTGCVAPAAVDVLAAGVAADIWAVGCTVMEMLTGKRPWAHLSSNALKSLQMLMSEAEAAETAMEEDEWGDLASDTTPTPTLPPDLTPLALSFLKGCLAFDPMRRLNADALLCHPWLTQFGLVDTHENVLRELLPIALNGDYATGLTANPDLLQRLANHFGSAGSISAGGSSGLDLGDNGNGQASGRLRSDAKLPTLSSDQADYVQKKEKEVKLNMNRLVHKTRALMRLGAFRAGAAKNPSAAGATDVLE